MYLIAFTAIAGLAMVFLVYFFSSKKEAALDEALKSFFKKANINVSNQLIAALNEIGIASVDELDDLDAEMAAKLEDSLRPKEKKRFRQSLVARKEAAVSGNYYCFLSKFLFY